jgi:uncharacterized protein YqeY
MTLKERIQEEMKAALKSQDSQTLATIRLLFAAVKDREINERTHGERVDLDDTQVLAVIDKMIKQRQDSITQFRQAGREELAKQEEIEIEVLQRYLPPPMSDQEIDALIQEAISKANATSIKDMGKVMADLKPILQGRADMGVVSNKIKQRLS